MTSDAFLPKPRNIAATAGGVTAHLRTASGSVPAGVSAHLENRSYGFKELAVLYFPNIAPASASIRLKAWIKDSPELLQILADTNYHLTARVLTPRQAGMIENAFGSPF